MNRNSSERNGHDFNPEADSPSESYGGRLLEAHQQYLRERAISPEIAAERGYVSADTKAQLKRLGFSGAQQDLVPSLVIPVHGVDGEVVGYQLRPDSPRMVHGRVTKFESRASSSLHLDVPPRVRQHLANPDIPLVFTEGAVKADAAAARGLACVALFGVYGWKAKNDFGGTAVMPELEYLHLKGRQVLLAFDSDIMLKPQVYDALRRFYAVLQHKGADVGVIVLPAGEHAEKTGLDDFFARGGTIDELMQRVQKHLPLPPSDDRAAPEGDVEPIIDSDATMESLLDATLDYISRFLIFSSEHEVRAITLWVAHAWFLDAFDVTPRLLITAPTKRAGKSRVLDVLQRIVPRGKRYGSASGASLFRAIDKLRPVLLIDEIDRVFRHANVDPGADLIAQVINIGWERGNPAVRVDGPDREVVEFETFAPVALAGIDKGGNVPDTVVDRSVLIAMPRKKKHQPVERFRRRGNAAAEGNKLKASWAGFLLANPDVVAALSGAYPQMPSELHDRAQDAWEPLVAVADVAEATWPLWARAAAVALTGTDQGDEDGYGVLLLRDIKRIWPAEQEVLRSKELVEKLMQIEDSPWRTWANGKGLTANALSNILKPFGVKSRQISVAGHHDARGYSRAGFEEPWAQYCSEDVRSAPSSVPTVPSVETQGSDEEVNCPAGPEAGTLQTPSEALPDNARDTWDTSTPANPGYEIF